MWPLSLSKPNALETKENSVHAPPKSAPRAPRPVRFARSRRGAADPARTPLREAKDLRNVREWDHDPLLPIFAGVSRRRRSHRRGVRGRICDVQRLSLDGGPEGPPLQPHSAYRAGAADDDESGAGVDGGFAPEVAHVEGP